MMKRVGSVLCIGAGPIELNLRCALLKESGWEVLSSGTGHEGVLVFSQESVDAVILDLNSDGSESALIAGELRRQRPRLPIIMVVEEHKHRVDGATDLANAVINKSDEAQTMVPTLTRLLQPKQ
jgi:DNA-binding response OmpR family regulator